jgi:NAD(P)-dependent dehydrogenase (short-subunit alcohol dehydrogenase family)
MCTFQFGEGLRNQVIVKEINLSVTTNPHAAIAPTRYFGNEIWGAGKLDTDLLAVLHAANGFKHALRFGRHTEVDVYGAVPPAIKKRGGATDQKDASGRTSLVSQDLQRAAQTLYVDGWSHALMCRLAPQSTQVAFTRGGPVYRTAGRVFSPPLNIQVLIMAKVLVTGSNRGIGLELVKAFRQRGDTVFALCRTTNPDLEATNANIITGIDVTDDALLNVLPRALEDITLDIVVLNAGVLSSESLQMPNFDAIRHQFEVNTLGPLRAAIALLPNLKHGSKIGIITSRMGSVADNTSGGMYGYRASKAAVNAVGRSLAMDLKERGVAVQLLHPGFVRTDLTRGNGIINADESARTLVERIDELTLEETGTFRHQNGEYLPW